MSLASGKQLGSYAILSAIGKGGMGEVYRARDTRLDRDVAIKTLPDEFEQDAERLARFEREAKLLASLNHPNVAAIYGLEKFEGRHFLVLELVEGQTLADHIARGPISVEEALRLAQQIAEALQAAHEKGVIHRDLKPDNIKITHDGTVKVLDFGLAKAMDLESSDGNLLSNSPTLRTLASTPGMILGTAAYMSPEQAKGRPVDRRTDIFAFGCVLYEMLTGKRAFEGEDVSDTLAAVLRAEPHWNALPRGVSPTLQSLVQRCLAKDRAQRIADMSVVKFLLAEPAVTRTGSSQPRSHFRTTLWIAAAAILSAAIGGALGWKLRPATSSFPVVRFAIDLPQGQTFNSTVRPNFAVSRDGTQIVYAANSRLYRRSISEAEARPIAGSESVGDVVSEPLFSPDGQSIAFFSGNAIKTIPLDGGTPVTLAPTTAPLGMTWTSEGIAFVGPTSESIFRLAPDGGTPERLITVKNPEGVYRPQILPGGQSVLFTLGSRQNASWDEAKIVVQSLKTGERKTLVDGGSDARYLPSGHLLYSVGGTVWAVAFDARNQTVTGKGVPVIQGVRRSTTPAANSAVTQLAVSNSGTLLYVPGPATSSVDSRSLVFTDRNGARRPLPLPPGPYRHPRVSRDGKHAAVGVDDGREAYISIYDLSTTRPLRRLTFGGHNRFPVWSGDSQFVAFQSDRDGDLGIFIQRADGSSPPERLTKAEPGVSQVPESWSHDGKNLLFSAKKDAAFSLWSFSLVNKQVMPFGNVQSLETIGATFSPDDHWVAYTWTDVQAPNRGSTNRGVYIQPFPPTGVMYQVPREFRDFHPAWGATAAELFYIPTAVRLSVVSVQTKPNLTFGKAVSLPTAATRDRASPETRDYDVMPDGQSFLSSVPVGDEGVSAVAGTTQIRVVVNWLRELQERVPVK